MEEEKLVIEGLPTIGILIFEGFLTNEVVAPFDVFAAPKADGSQLFNVVTIAKENKSYLSEEGLKVHPDFTIKDVPDLDVLVIPSSYHPDQQVKDPELINFIMEQSLSADYLASHCAGAFMMGESGVVDEKKIVTYVTGGESLQKDYPKLKVMNDDTVSVVQDGNFISSNGSLVSYLASLQLLERMTDRSHRKHVEEHLLLDRLISQAGIYQDQ